MCYISPKIQRSTCNRSIINKCYWIITTLNLYRWILNSCVIVINQTIINYLFLLYYTEWNWFLQRIVSTCQILQRIVSTCQILQRIVSTCQIFMRFKEPLFFWPNLMGKYTNKIIYRVWWDEVLLFVGINFRGFYKMQWSLSSWIRGFKHYRHQSMGKLHFFGF